jgi:hypothetical protein
MRVLPLVLLFVVALVGTAFAQDPTFIDPDALGGAIAGSGLMDLAPEWLAAIIPALVVTVCSLVNALVPNKYLGPAAKIINGGALALGKAKVDPAAQEA